MTQAQQAQPFATPRVALMTMLLVGALAIGIVSGLALGGSSLVSGLGGDEGATRIDPAVLLSGIEWEQQREQQRMFGDTIPAAWFQARGE